MNALTTTSETTTVQLGKTSLTLPRLIQADGERTTKRFLEFFTATIRNANTRAAYARALRDFFAWCDEFTDVADLASIEPLHVAAYIEAMTEARAPQTVKQHLAAIRSLFDFLVTGGMLAANPAASVRGPRFSQRKGKTPILFADDARALLRSIPTDTLGGLRDRAIIGTMTYGFARVSAALGLDVRDVYPKHHRLWLRLSEKNGKQTEIPCHHNLEAYLREYIEAAGIEGGPLFRTLRGRTGELNERRLQRAECLAMVRRRAKAAGMGDLGLCNHSFRGTGITAYLENPDSRLELAQELAGHSDPKTTRMYDGRTDRISLDEVEKIGI